MDAVWMSMFFVVFQVSCVCVAFNPIKRSLYGKFQFSNNNNKKKNKNSIHLDVCECARYM